MEEKKKPGTVSRWLRFTVSAGITGFLLTRVDFHSFGNMLDGAKPIWLCVAALMVMLNQVVFTLTWRAMLLARGCRPPFSNMLHMAFVCDFLGLILPSSMGSDVLKAVGLARFMKNTADAVSSLVILRAIGYGVSFALALLAIVIFGDRLPDDPAISFITVALVAFLIVGIAGGLLGGGMIRLLGAVMTRVGFGALYQKIYSLHDTFSFYLRHRGALIKALTGSFYLQVIKILEIYIVAKGLGIDVDMASVFAFVPIINTITMIPVSISGIGVREGGYVALFAYVGLSTAQSMSLSIIGFAIVAAGGGLVGAVLYARYGFTGAGDSAETEMMKIK